MSTAQTFYFGVGNKGFEVRMTPEEIDEVWEGINRDGEGIPEHETDEQHAEREAELLDLGAWGTADREEGIEYGDKLMTIAGARFVMDALLGAEIDRRFAEIPKAEDLGFKIEIEEIEPKRETEKAPAREHTMIDIGKGTMILSSEKTETAKILADLRDKLANDYGKDTIDRIGFTHQTPTADAERDPERVGFTLPKTIEKDAAALVEQTLADEQETTKKPKGKGTKKAKSEAKAEGQGKAKTAAKDDRKPEPKAQEPEPDEWEQARRDTEKQATASRSR